ncbi:probable calcium-binding protein CML41 [Ricinus communis]|uniref:Calmodulin, putative n=1 Tax=Ricinus communis TaxID=3988 RepID=B9T4V5_RICCO|nr:probable calcium-binding protein CML41 [Ricinus communis]EEF29106.1 Calmodulin, putative [Ricinus communis]|eukprot:XP_002533274.1 probable calcium-binding protein CML41 [Ricinus communis]
MAKERILKPSKWFSNKGLRLSLNRGRSKSSSSSTLSCSPPSPMSPCTPKNNTLKVEDELKEVFRHFDTDGDEKVSALELRSFFGSVGEFMSHEEAESVINDLDSDGDKLLDFNDFLKLMKREGNSNPNDQDHEDDLKKAFEMFEMEKGSGCITPKGLQRMLHRLGDSKSYDECVAMIHVFDIDGNGVLDFHEFYQMMA